MKCWLLPFNLPYSTRSQKTPKLTKPLGKEEHWKLYTPIWYSPDPKSEMGGCLHPWFLGVLCCSRSELCWSWISQIMAVPENRRVLPSDRTVWVVGWWVSALFSCPEHLAREKILHLLPKERTGFALNNKCNLSTSHSLHNPTFHLVGQINLNNAKPSINLPTMSQKWHK